MNDLVFIVVAAVFFLVTVAFVVALDRI